MNAFDYFFPARVNPPRHRGLTRYFFLSALILIGAFAYVALWSVLSQRLTGDGLYRIVGTPAELQGGGLVVLHGGGLIVILGLIGMLWVFLTGFAARGAALRERDRRIAELETRLGGGNAN